MLYIALDRQKASCLFERRERTGYCRLVRYFGPKVGDICMGAPSPKSRDVPRRMDTPICCICIPWFPSAINRKFLQHKKHFSTFPGEGQLPPCPCLRSPIGLSTELVQNSHCSSSRRSRKTPCFYRPWMLQNLEVIITNWYHSNLNV